MSTLPRIAATVEDRWPAGAAASGDPLAQLVLASRLLGADRAIANFGGGNTSYEALALGIPVVTLPSSFMRGRVTAACYHKMGLSDCVAESAADYVKRAAKFGVWKKYDHLVIPRGDVVSITRLGDVHEAAVKAVAREYELCFRCHAK